MASQAEILAEAATIDSPDGPYWENVMELCRLINSSPRQANVALKVLKERLGSKDTKIQLLTLTVLEALSKYCGNLVHNAVTSGDILNEMLEKLEQELDSEVKEKIIILVNKWLGSTQAPSDNAVLPQSHPVMHQGETSATPQTCTLNPRPPDFDEIQKKVILFVEMLDGMDPGPRERMNQRDIAKVVEQSRFYQVEIANAAGHVGNDEDGKLNRIIEMHAELDRVIEQYSSMMCHGDTPEMSQLFLSPSKSGGGDELSQQPAVEQQLPAFVNWQYAAAPVHPATDKGKTSATPQSSTSNPRPFYFDEIQKKVTLFVDMLYGMDPHDRERMDQSDIAKVVKQSRFHQLEIANAAGHIGNDEVGKLNRILEMHAELDDVIKQYSSMMWHGDTPEMSQLSLSPSKSGGGDELSQQPSRPAVGQQLPAFVNRQSAEASVHNAVLRQSHPATDKGKTSATPQSSTSNPRPFDFDEIQKKVTLFVDMLYGMNPRDRERMLQRDIADVVDRCHFYQVEIANASGLTGDDEMEKLNWFVDMNAELDGIIKQYRSMMQRPPSHMHGDAPVSIPYVGGDANDEAEEETPQLYRRPSKSRGPSAVQQLPQDPMASSEGLPPAEDETSQLYRRPSAGQQLPQDPMATSEGLPPASSSSPPMLLYEDDELSEQMDNMSLGIPTPEYYARSPRRRNTL